jgi:hypothetical protein
VVPYTQWTVLRLKDNLVHHLSHNCGMRVFGVLAGYMYQAAMLLSFSGNYLLSMSIRQDYV